MGFIFLTRWAVPDWLVAGGDYVLAYGWIFLTISLPMWLYFILFESGPREATPGKALLGPRVTDLAGRSAPAELRRHEIEDALDGVGVVLDRGSLVE